MGKGGLMKRGKERIIPQIEIIMWAGKETLLRPTIFKKGGKIGV